MVEVHTAEIVDENSFCMCALVCVYVCVWEAVVGGGSVAA